MNLTVEYTQGLIDKCEQQRQKALKELDKIGIETQYLDTITNNVAKYEQYLNQHLSRLSFYLTEVLQRIYENRVLEVVITAGKGKVEFAITEGGITIPVDNIGGGICAVLDVFIRMFLVKMFNYTPIIFLDESLSFVADDVFDIVLREIENYAIQNNLTCVYVSHGRGEYDTKYIFEKIGDTTTIKRV
jgi:hypothetical protein